VASRTPAARGCRLACG